jgi:putative ABC transport system permease protein
MDLKEVITHSWESLHRNRLRSVLTMLGIVWGLATVVLLLGYGSWLRAERRRECAGRVHGHR